MCMIVVEQECSCFVRSRLQKYTMIESKDEALIKAQEMVLEMNREFCGKHQFHVYEDGETFTIYIAN